MTKLKLSVLICTYNRYPQLTQVLDDLEYQSHDLPADASWELIVINNNSTDLTQALLTSIRASHKNLSAVMKPFIEEEQGSSAARNRGIKESCGNLIAFVDDDVRLDAHWLETAYELAETMPVNKVFGGRVIAKWAKALPDWLNLEAPFEIIQSAFPAHDYGDQNKTYPFQFGRREIYNPISANLLCTRDLFEKYGNFREDLGIQGNQRGACEDTELSWRFLAHGAGSEYLADLIVYHPVSEERMTKDFVLAWYRLLGKTLAWMKLNNLDHLNKSKKSKNFSYINSLIKAAVFLCLWFISHLSFRPKQIFWYLAQYHKTLGELDVISKIR